MSPSAPRWSAASVFPGRRCASSGCRSPRLVTTRTNVDMTDRMTAWAKERVEALEKENLDGFIFKSGSPSSGMERVKVYNDRGVPEKKGVGLFARAFMDRFPLLPVEDEGRLHDVHLRENFIESVFTLHRWREAVGKGRTSRVLVDFHSRHKLLLMAHSPKHSGNGKARGRPGKPLPGGPLRTIPEGPPGGPPAEGDRGEARQRPSSRPGLFQEGPERGREAGATWNFSRNTAGGTPPDRAGDPGRPLVRKYDRD